MKNALQNLKEILKNPLVGAALVFAFSAAYFIWVIAAPAFPDPDTWYHLKMAEMIRTNGPVMNFPWLTETTLKDVFVDHHLVYHYFLIPFTSFFGNLIGAKVATVLLAAAVMGFLYFMLRRFRVEYSFLFILLAATNVHFIFRILLTKASALAILILLMGIYAMIRNRWIILFLINAIYVSVHGGFVLLPFSVVLYVACRAFTEEILQNPVPFHLRPYGQVVAKYFKRIFSPENSILLLAGFLGVLVGVLLNPYQLKLLPFLQVQLWQIGVMNKAGQIPVGNEWYPLAFPDFIKTHFVVLTAWAFAAVSMFSQGKRITLKQFFFFFLSALFLALTIRSRRFAEYFIPFAILYCGLVFSNLKYYVKRVMEAVRMYGAAIALMFQILLAFAAASFVIIDVGIARDLYASFHDTRSLTYMAGVAGWLKNHVTPNQTVFQTDWSDFPNLFYYDDNHYYITGLDPTFMYDKNPGKYREYEGIVKGTDKDDLYRKIRYDFNSETVVLKNNSSAFEENLKSSPDFINVYSDRDGVIYVLKPSHE